MLSRIQEINPDVTIVPVTDATFTNFGKIIKTIDFTALIRQLSEIPIPADGNKYIADDADLHISPAIDEVRSRLFGEMKIEIGFCNGHTHCLNALEYHKSSEINISATDCILMLASFFDIKDDEIASDDVSLYFLPAGIAVELYATTLHFAPCAVDANGFRVGVILPEHTNDPLANGRNLDEPLLFAKNKWLIAHADSPSAKRGAHVGIIGENILLNI